MRLTKNTNRAEFRAWKRPYSKVSKNAKPKKKAFQSPRKPNPPVGKYDASHLNVPLAGNVGLPQFVSPELPLQTPMGVKWPSNPVGAQTAFVCFNCGKPGHFRKSCPLLVGVANK